MTQHYDPFVHYVILLSLNEGRSLTEELIRGHISYLRQLEENGQLVLCGPFGNVKGGMVIIRAGSFEEAEEIAKLDPFISSGAEAYEVRVWNLSNEANNHLGMG